MDIKAISELNNSTSEEKYQRIYKKIKKIKKERANFYYELEMAQRKISDGA